MKLSRVKNIFFLPSILTLIFLSAIYFYPDVFTAPVIALMYWAFGSLIILTITQMLRSELQKKSQLAKELEQQKRYLENLIESAPEGIVWADQDSQIKYVNQKFTDIFGFTLDDAQGQNIDTLLSPHGNISEARKITQAIASGITQQFETVRSHKDGTLIHVSIVGAPLVSLNGKLELFGIYRDITQEKTAEKQLIESEKSLRLLSDQLLDANNFKELLLDIITHDLRNPAGVISSALELLTVEFPNHEVLGIIQKSSDNLFEVIESASTLSKLSMGEQISLQKMDIVPLLKEVADTFKSQLANVNMTLKVDLPESIILKSNRIIGEVLSNYISNAIKYASESNTLILTAKVKTTCIQIELQDQGQTIPEDQRENIFRRKVQLLNGPRSGSGLGLAIVKRIATAHNAIVGVTANEPRGNIFYFKFDLTQAD